MAAPPNDTSEVVRAQLLPLMEELCRVTSQSGRSDQHAFFDRIRRALEQARDPDDMAGPFMELSTSAFRGFQFDLEVSMLLDRVLERAQMLSMTLSASTTEAH